MRIVGLAVLTLVCGVGVLLAPVRVDDPVVTWPAAGQAPTSTTLALSPYRPLSLRATVPCAALRALAQRPAGGAALRTMPARLAVPDYPGLRVAVDGATVRVTASGQRVVTRPVPDAGPCVYRFRAEAGTGLVVSPPRGPPVAAPGVLVPQVAELATAVPDGARRGLAVTLRTDARYESQPTPAKLVLLGLHLASLAGLLVLVTRRWSGAGPGLSRPRWGAADAVLAGVSLLWVVLAPLNFDDSWYPLMAREFAESGAVGNAIYLFNAAENPFVAAQYLQAGWAALGGWGLLWMRLLPLVYALATWALLRVLLATLLDGRAGRRVTAAPWALLLAQLVWWLPYGMTLRPEPLIVVLSAGVLVLAELARRRASIGVLALAVAVAALALTVSPSGLVAAAPLLVSLPWVWRWLRAAPNRTRLAAVLALAAAGTALIPVGFADATLGTVAESIAMRGHYYTTYAWYQEYIHYKTLLVLIDSSQWARRAPVLLSLAVIAAVALVALVALARRRREPGGDALRRLLGPLAVTSAAALALLAFTPTKWVNHFGAAAAAPTVLLAVALLRSPVPRRPGRAGRALSATSAGLLVVALAVSYAGPNLWRPYTDRGQPFGNHLAAAGAQLTPYGTYTSPELRALAPHLGPVFARNPLLWVAVALLVLAWAARRRRRGLAVRLGPDRGLLAIGGVSVVALLIGVFAAAPLRQYPGWTVALSHVAALAGDRCGLAEYGQVLVPTGPQPRPERAIERTRPAPLPAPARGSAVWHTAGDAADTVTTPWFAVPDSTATHLLVPLAGAELSEQRVRLQYADRPGPDPAVAGSVPVSALPTVTAEHTGPAPLRAVSAGDWQQARVSLDRVGARPPAAVRLVLTDRIREPGIWLAAGPPRLATWQPVGRLTGQRPVYADQVSSALWPCVDQVTVQHGVAQAPAVRLLADEGFPRGFLDLAFEVARGGTQVQADRMATTVRIPSRLQPSGGPATLPWGRVERVVYQHPVGLVDVAVRQQHRWGWVRLPSLSRAGYTDRPVPP